ncbi:hypothetical protein [Aeromonas hydrophila]
MKTNPPKPFDYRYIHLNGYLVLQINMEQVKFMGSSFKHINGGNIYANSSSEAVLEAIHPKTGDKVSLLVHHDKIVVTSHGDEEIIRNELCFQIITVG